MASAVSWAPRPPLDKHLTPPGSQPPHLPFTAHTWAMREEPGPARSLQLDLEEQRDASILRWQGRPPLLSCRECPTSPKDPPQHPFTSQPHRDKWHTFHSSKDWGPGRRGMVESGPLLPWSRTMAGVGGTRALPDPLPASPQGQGRVYSTHSAHGETGQKQRVTSQVRRVFEFQSWGGANGLGPQGGDMEPGRQGLAPETPARPAPGLWANGLKYASTSGPPGPSRAGPPLGQHPPPRQCCNPGSSHAPNSLFGGRRVSPGQGQVSALASQSPAPLLCQQLASLGLSVPT